MRRFALIPVLVFCISFAAPLRAEPDASPPAEDGLAQPFFDLMERMLRGFMTEIEPQLRDLERGLDALEPQVQNFLDQMRGMTQYHPPEVLPNGDILLRRRAPDEIAPPPDDQDAGSPFEL